MSDIDTLPDAMLDALQARVLGCLMEKQMTTPDYYPLTLNALVAACNQKSSRNPVMNLSPQQVSSVINELRREGLVTANTLARADRYEQFLSRRLHLSSKERAVLCVMLLRGPHTLNEIRVNTNRMTAFADQSEIVTTLKSMMERDEPLIAQLPRAPGQREDRYTHLLCGTPADETPQARSVPAAVSDETLERIAHLEARVARLEAELKDLKEGHTSSFL